MNICLLKLISFSLVLIIEILSEKITDEDVAKEFLQKAFEEGAKIKSKLAYAQWAFDSDINQSNENKLVCIKFYNIFFNVLIKVSLFHNN